MREFEFESLTVRVMKKSTFREFDNLRESLIVREFDDLQGSSKVGRSSSSRVQQFKRELSRESVRV